VPKVASNKNFDLRLAAFLIDRLAAEGGCIGEYRTLILDAVIEAANELARKSVDETNSEERFSVISEKALNELRGKINGAAGAKVDPAMTAQQFLLRQGSGAKNGGQ
jgi:hypothetical protein